MSPATADGSVDAAAALTLTVSAVYRAASGGCASQDFGPYMRVAWRVLNGTMLSRPSVVANQSSLTLPAKYFVPGTSYTAVALLSRMNGEYQVGLPLTFTATYTPTVSITATGSRLVVGQRGIRVAAAIVDAFPAEGGSAVVWSAACGGECPAALTDGLAVNGTNSSAYLSGPVAAGTYTLTATYRGVASAPLTLVVSGADAAFQVSVKALSTPVVSPNVYLSTQTLAFAALVNYTANATVLNWTVNGGSHGNKSMLSLLRLRFFWTRQGDRAARDVRCKRDCVRGEPAGAWFRFGW